MITLRELPENRERYGGCQTGGQRDQRAINRHSIRTYLLIGPEGEPIHEAPLIYLNRNNSGVPAFFEAYYFPPEGGVSRRIVVDNDAEYWGGGISWKGAERQLTAAMNAHLKEGVRGWREGVRALKSAYSQLLFRIARQREEETGVKRPERASVYCDLCPTKLTPEQYEQGEGLCPTCCAFLA